MVRRGAHRRGPFLGAAHRHPGRAARPRDAGHGLHAEEQVPVRARDYRRPEKRRGGPMNAPGVRPGEGEFLSGYDPASFPPFAVAVDLAIFTIRAGLLAVLLVQRRDHPYQGYWAMPGGFVRTDES